ncbi:MAG: hypothetical protein ACQETG_02895 [Thermodesulfobacteriota bacterium]
MQEGHKNETVFNSWVVVCLLVLLILAKGLFAFAVVGDRGQPGWSYGTVQDVPASSPYSEYDLLPHPQHVRGVRGE